MMKGVRMLTREYYRMIARVIKNNTIINNDKMLPTSTINKITFISDLMNEFHNDNNLFNGNKFIDACAIDDD